MYFPEKKGVKFDSNLPNSLILSTIPNKTLFGIASVKYYKPPHRNYRGKIITKNECPVLML